MLLRSLLMAGAVTWGGLVGAQTPYPTKTIEFVSASQPGGATDMVARLIGPKLTAAWGQPYIVTYKPGAGGNIGPQFVAGAKNDGYTLLVSFAGMMISPALYPDLRYDPVKDFAPVTLVAKAPLVLVAAPKLPARTLPELIAYGKSNPGQLNWGHGGAGTAQHLSGLLFASAAGIDVLQVPFNGSSAVTTALLSDTVHVQFDNLVSLAPHVKSGKMRALAVSSTSRLRSLPDVPTMAESGLPGFEAGSWYGIFAPAGTPLDIVDRLSREIAKIVASPEVQDRLIELGLVPVTNSPAEYAEMVRSEKDRYARIVRQAGIKLQ